MTPTSCPTPASKEAIRRAYREFVHFLKQQSPSSASQWNELRQAFRQPIQTTQGQTAESRLQLAQSRLSFLRMTHPRSSLRRSAEESNNGGRSVFVYHNGRRMTVGETVNSEGTSRSNSRVHSNWDGSNLDPDSVKRHKYQLRRAGFANNAHAKGFF
jgi:hypothetical protein